MASLFPDGILFDGIVYKILPGGYAVIGESLCLSLSSPGLISVSFLADFIFCFYMTVFPLLSQFLFYPTWERCSSSDGSSQPHCLHCCDLL